MLNRFKNAVIGAVTGSEANGIPYEQQNHAHVHSNNKQSMPPKFAYGRPAFLDLSEDEVQMSADHKLRPIIHPNTALPHHSGYAECVNAGKSKRNEDQAVIKQGVLASIEYKGGNVAKRFSIPYTYYGIFDGHAGVGAALCASHQLHHILHEKLVDAQDDIWLSFLERDTPKGLPCDLLIIGAFEAAFKEMDQVLAEDRTKYQAAGGCTALAALFILDKLYVANAGDSRAIICTSGCEGDSDGGSSVAPQFSKMSMDFTPENERERIRKLGEEQPSLLGPDFTSREYLKPPHSTELGKTIMYRDAHMTGWAYKTLGDDDLKISVITGKGKRSRVMGTIGVTRGFGDHDLYSVYHRTPIKPLLSCRPEVQIHRLQRPSSNQNTPSITATSTANEEVLVMATDGLWDVVSGETAAEVVSRSMATFHEKKERYVSAATCLVGAARGSLVNEYNYWKLKNGKVASADDISVFVIPLAPYRLAYDGFVQELAESCAVATATNTITNILQ